MAEKTIKKNATKKETTKKTTKAKPKEKKLTAEEKQKIENIKAYKILSYIGILWLIGLLVPEKDEKDLKFHVGQGIILSIVELLLSFFSSIINTFFVGLIFREEIYYNTQPTGIYTLSIFGSLISTVLKLSIVGIVIYFMVIGITNVLNNKQKELPIIGKYSFYK